MAEFELTFDGAFADRGLLDFYDAGKALSGFQRSLALTAHLVINGEIITQAPAAKGFQLLIPPFERGSWKSKAIFILPVAMAALSAGKDSPLGQIVTSVYDVVLNHTMGFHVDYNKTLQEQYGEYLAGKKITSERIDALCEKIEASIADMHRPIVISQTATRASVERCDGRRVKLGPDLNSLIYDYVKQTIINDEDENIIGYVASYNINTYSGRIYSLIKKRLIPFELQDTAKNAKMIGLITRSQHLNGQSRSSGLGYSNDAESLVSLAATELSSPTGRTKKYLVSKVVPAPLQP